MMVPVKTCCICGKAKPLDQFRVDRKAADGRKRHRLAKEA
jgi:hypothetical protein